MELVGIELLRDVCPKEILQMCEHVWDTKHAVVKQESKNWSMCWRKGKTMFALCSNSMGDILITCGWWFFMSSPI